MSRVAVLLVLASDDPALNPDTLDAMTEVPGGMTSIWRAVVAALPGGVTRVVAVMPEGAAKLLMQCLEEWSETALAAECVRPEDVN